MVARAAALARISGTARSGREVGIARPFAYALALVAISQNNTCRIFIASYNGPLVADGSATLFELDLALSGLPSQ